MATHWDDLENAEPATFRPPATTDRQLTLRLDAELLRRLRAVAARRRMGYHALARLYLLERLRQDEAEASATRS